MTTSTGSTGSKVWFITGANRGFGRSFAQAALRRGDKVVATARRPDTLQDLVDEFGDAVRPVALDVTDRAQVFDVVADGWDAFGRLDVVVNNAGYGLSGAVEEASEQESRQQIETNLFGALWVTQAVLPRLRAQGSGHVVQVSSVGGVAAFPLVGLYHASKWGLEGFSESVAQEVAPFGVHVTLVEPSGFRTDWAGNSMTRTTPIDAYTEQFPQRREQMSGDRAGSEPGDPDAAAEALLRVVDMAQPPLRLLLGNMAYDVATKAYSDRLAQFAAWEDTSRGADRPAA